MLLGGTYKFRTGVDPPRRAEEIPGLDASGRLHVSWSLGEGRWHGRHVHRRGGKRRGCF